jgi:lysophospholipase L1-like esterase
LVEGSMIVKSLFKHLRFQASARPLVLGWTVVVIVLFAGVGPAICGPSRLISNLEAGLNQTVLTYGTSLTRPGDWPNQLDAWFQSEFPGQVQLINRGIPSSSSQNADPFFDALVQLDARVLSNNPDTVFIEFAVNDALVGNNVSPQQSGINVNTMIDRILAGHADRVIILMTMNPAWDPPGQFGHGSARPNLPAYYQVYREVAAQRGLLLIDNYANWLALRNTNESLFEQYVPDGVHPTAEALQQIVTPRIIHDLTVPEPSGMAMLMVGCAAVASVDNRRRRMRARYAASRFSESTSWRRRPWLRRLK